MHTTQTVADIRHLSGLTGNVTLTFIHNFFSSQKKNEENQDLWNGHWAAILRKYHNYTENVFAQLRKIIN